MKTCSVIIVTYNSEKFIHKCLDSLFKQTVQPTQIIIVDTGSKDRSYLDPYRKNSSTQVIHAPQDSGFCCGNNTGYRYVEKNVDAVLLLNPDAFLTPDCIEKAMHALNKNPNVGALTGSVEKYDIQTDTPSGVYDTTGIFSTWYGRWYDRDQGELIERKKYQKEEVIPAICGALFFCRKEALDSVLINGKEIFNPKFYMYKEDIDLSLRLRKKGWKLLFLPFLQAYHCRGWSENRRTIPRIYRLSSARNELRIQKQRFHPIGWLYAVCKYTAVKVFDR